MTTPDEHVAVPARGTDGGRIACSCGQWRSEVGDGLSNERAAHRAHRAEMGEATDRADVSSEPAEYFWTMTVQWQDHPGRIGLATSSKVFTPEPDATHSGIYEQAFAHVREVNNIACEPIVMHWHLAPNRIGT